MKIEDDGFKKSTLAIKIDTEKSEEIEKDLRD